MNELPMRELMKLTRAELCGLASRLTLSACFGSPKTVSTQGHHVETFPYALDVRRTELHGTYHLHSSSLSFIG
jgi:hypothetical protein